MADEKQLEILQEKANFRHFKPKPFNMREFSDRAGHDIQEMLLSCFFRGEPCGPDDFKVVSCSFSYLRDMCICACLYVCDGQYVFLAVVVAGLGNVPDPKRGELMLHSAVALS